MVATTTLDQCALCDASLAGIIPYGPPDAEVCLACWHQCGSYAAVRTAAAGRECGGEPEPEPEPISEFNRAAIITVSGDLDALSSGVDDALDDADLDRLEGLVSDIERAARELQSAVVSERGRREREGKGA